MSFAYTVFSTAASAALSMVQIDGAGQTSSILFRPFVRNIDDVSLPLHERVRRLVMFRVAELLVWFIVLNALGVFMARFFIRTSDIDSQQWDWMTTFYWAVQTTTTIGESPRACRSFELVHCLTFTIYRIWWLGHAIWNAVVPNLLHNLRDSICRSSLWSIRWIEQLHLQYSTTLCLEKERNFEEFDSWNARFRRRW